MTDPDGHEIPRDWARAAWRALDMAFGGDGKPNPKPGTLSAEAADGALRNCIDNDVYFVFADIDKSVAIIKAWA